MRLGLALGLVGLMAFAQEPESPTFRANTRLVQVDVPKSCRCPKASSPTGLSFKEPSRFRPL